MPTKQAVEAVKELVGQYRPHNPAVRAMLNSIREEAFTAVACLTPGARNRATTAIGNICKYAMLLEELGVWSRDSGEPIPFTHRYVTLFCEQLIREGKPSARSVAAVLSAIGRSYQPHLWPRQIHPQEPRQFEAPYTLDQQLQYRTVSSDYRAVYDDARLEATLAAGLGAGIGPVELRVVRGTDITRDENDHVFLRVEGAKSFDRTVPVLPKWGDYLYDAAQAMGDQFLVSGRNANRKNHTALVTLPLRQFAGLHISPRRLRLTWIVERLAENVPMDLVAKYAGLETWQSFRLLYEFIEPRDTSEEHQWLRNGGQPS